MAVNLLDYVNQYEAAQQGRGDIGGYVNLFGQVNPPQQQAQPQPSGDGGGGGGEPAQPAGPSLEEINAIYDPIMSYLGQAESKLRGNQSGANKEITDAYNLSRQQTDQEKASGERQLGEAETKAGKSSENAMADARRLFQELTIGGRQRFGGLNPISEGFQALLGRELQRNQGGIQQGLQTAEREIQMQRANLQEKYALAVQQLELKKNQALAEAKRRFEDALLEINRMRAETESQKAQMRLDVLQQLRNNIHEINLSTATTAQQLQATANQLNQQVEAYGGVASNAVASGGQAADTFANTAQNFTGTDLALGNATSTTTTNDYTGQITPNRREEDVSSFNPFQQTTFA